MKTGFAMMISFLFLVSFWSPASSQVYQWKDKDGNIHFSDTPPPAGTGKELKIRKDREGLKADEISVEPLSQSLGKKRPYGDIKVILYMTDWCGYSKKTQTYLNSLGVSFVEYNVEQDRDKWREMMDKNGGKSAVPLTDVEGILIKGYHPGPIKAAVEKRRSMK